MVGQGRLRSEQDVEADVPEGRGRVSEVLRRRTVSALVIGIDAGVPYPEPV